MLIILQFLVFSASIFNTGQASRLPVEPRIVGGTTADIKDYPYQVSLMIDGDHACGGSILTVKYILTAAHCTFDTTESQLSIRAGSSYRTSGGQVVKVKKIYQHSSFNADTYDYDVSVLTLASSLVLGTGVATISMISASVEVTSGASCIATGWGQTSNDGALANQLQVVTLPAITTTKCQSYYGSAVNERMFCAGYQEGLKDTCTGDSGGPLVSNGILVGITSWGDICAKAYAPGVFVKISSFRTYIDQIVAQG